MLKINKIITNNIKRIYRFLFNRCLVCGEDVKDRINNDKYFYCSFTCASYDGTFSIKKGTIKQPKILKFD